MIGPLICHKKSKDGAVRKARDIHNGHGMKAKVLRGNVVTEKIASTLSIIKGRAECLGSPVLRLSETSSFAGSHEHAAPRMPNRTLESKILFLLNFTRPKKNQPALRPSMGMSYDRNLPGSWLSHCLCYWCRMLELA